MDLSSFFGALGGVSVVITGLIAYFGKVALEKYKNSLLEVTKKRDALIDKTIYVSKTQFDKEFLIYQEVWGKLVSLQDATMELRPMMDFHQKDQSEEERVQQRLEKYNKASNEFRNIVLNNKPFYPSPVYDELAKIIRLCRKEAIDYAHYPDKSSVEYWQIQKKNQDEILEAIEDCCKTIRNRIENLSVLP